MREGEQKRGKDNRRKSRKRGGERGERGGECWIFDGLFYRMDFTLLASW